MGDQMDSIGNLSGLIFKWIVIMMGVPDWMVILLIILLIISGLIFKWIAILFKWIVILIVIVVLAWNAAEWYSNLRLRNDTDDIAKSLAIGGSPFVIQLPKDHSVKIYITTTSKEQQCGYIAMSRNRESSLSTYIIDHQPVKISLNNGLLDLTPYIQSLKECDVVSIGVKGSQCCYFRVKYTDAKITNIGTIMCYGCDSD